VSTSDVGQVAVADGDPPDAAAADPVGCAIAQVEILVGDVTPTALIDDVPPERRFGKLSGLGRFNPRFL
jgi:hypothetical protein